MAKTSKEQPIYMAIYEDLRQQIFSGKLVPGDLLPSESQLCEAYQASRVTVRKGLQALGCSVGAPMMLVERVFTQQNGRPVGYSKQYLRQAYGYLEGTSGHMR